MLEIAKLLQSSREAYKHETPEERERKLPERVARYQQIRAKVFPLDKGGETCLFKDEMKRDRPFSLSTDLYKYPLYFCEKCNTGLFGHNDRHICYECARNNNLICYECRDFMRPSEIETHVCNRNENLICRGCRLYMRPRTEEEIDLKYEIFPEKAECSGKTFSLYCNDCASKATEDWTIPRKPKEDQIYIPPEAYKNLKGSKRPYYLGSELYSYMLELCFCCAGDLLRHYDSRICYDCARYNDLICRKCNVFMLPSTLIEHEYDDGKRYNLYCKECCKTMDWTIKPHNDTSWKEELEDKIVHAQYPFMFLKKLPKSHGSKKFDFVKNGKWVKVIYRIDKSKQRATTYSMFIKEIKVTRKAELAELSSTTHPGAKINAIYSKWYKELSAEQINSYREQAEEDNDKRGVRQASKAARMRSIFKKLDPIPVKKESITSDPIDKPSQSLLPETVPLIESETPISEDEEEEEDEDELIILDGAPDNVIFIDDDIIELYSIGAREVIYVTDDDEDEEGEEVVISLKRPAPVRKTETRGLKKSRYCEIVY